MTTTTVEKTAYKRMNPDAKRLLIEALRSGDYKQGQQALCTVEPIAGPHYCCLGVLCEVAIKQGIHVETSDDQLVGGGILRGYLDEGLKKTGVPPRVVLDWAGIDENDMPGNPVSLMINMNDHEGASFEVIADWVERNL